MFLIYAATLMIVAFVLALLTWPFFSKLAGSEPTSRQRIEEQAKNLTSSLKQAVEVINNLEAEISSRTVLAEKLQRDIEQFNQLAELKKSEIEAVSQLLRKELEAEGKKFLWKGAVIGFFYMIFGAIISKLLPLFISWLKLYFTK